MAANISAEEGALHRGAQAVAEAKAGIDRQIARVRSEIEQVGGMWTGSAAVQYTSMMTEWDAKTKKLNAVLDTLEESLVGTSRDQAATEDSHKQTINSLQSMMGA
jgi:WXG100 family type VII secretion target